LRWYLLAGEPAKGTRLDNENLAEALTQRAYAARAEFTQQEWDSFGVQELRIDNYVRAATSFYKPALRLPSTAMVHGDLVFS
jgi:hypothetical protein